MEVCGIAWIALTASLRIRPRDFAAIAVTISKGFIEESYLMERDQALRRATRSRAVFAWGVAFCSQAGHAWYAWAPC